MPPYILGSCGAPATPEMLLLDNPYFAVVADWLD
jgi:hypothetical protein